jgi:hypothetical protein
MQLIPATTNLSWLQFPRQAIHNTTAIIGCMCIRNICLNFFFNSHSGGGVQTASSQHVDHFWPIMRAPGDREVGEFGGMKIGRGNRSTRRKPAPASLCPTTNLI